MHEIEATQNARVTLERVEIGHQSNSTAHTYTYIYIYIDIDADAVESKTGPIFGVPWVKNWSQRCV